MKLALLFASIAAATQLPAGIKSLESPSGKQYALFEAAQGSNRGDAIAKCVQIGGRLADVSLGGDFEFLSKSVSGAAWISTFEQKSFDGACIAFFEGGAIAVPVGNCESIQGVLCEL